MQENLWFKHAVAFAVRTRGEMWGKHNAEVLAFLFNYGFRNSFVRECLMGWNRRIKTRNPEDWGVEFGDKLVIPAGLVIPYVVGQKLRKLTVVQHTVGSSNLKSVVPGSAPISMVFGKGSIVAVVENILDGLLLHQELDNAVTVIIPHDLGTPADSHVEALLREACDIHFFPDRFSEAVSSTEDWSTFMSGAAPHEYHILDEMIAACRPSE